jgi:hypothetical protein
MNRFTSRILGIRTDRGLYIGKYSPPPGKCKGKRKKREIKGKASERKEKEKEKIGSKRLNKCKKKD